MSKDDSIDILNNYTRLINYWLANVHEIEGITKLVRDSSEFKYELLGRF